MADAALARAQKLRKEERYPEAIAAAQEAIKADPADYGPYAVLGVLHAENGNLSEARRAIALAQSKAPADRKASFDKFAAELQSQSAAASQSQRHENSLGMKFAPVPGTDVLFCLWKTRVKDFAAFESAGYRDPEGGWGMWSWDTGESKFKQLGHSWKNPGFEQTALHPVCGVSFADAQNFCRWLTEKDRRAGLIGEHQSYRLPTDAEWSVAVGKGKYPWGDQWPPPQGAGNYADESSDLKYKIAGYRDGYNRTSPVGSFRENRFGLYDLGGNLWEWCEDWYRADMNTEETKKAIPALADDKGGQTYRVLRGGAWDSNSPVHLASGYRGNVHPLGRDDSDGFRCVLVVGVGSR